MTRRTHVQDAWDRLVLVVALGLLVGAGILAAALVAALVTVFRVAAGWLGWRP